MKSAVDDPDELGPDTEAAALSDRARFGFGPRYRFLILPKGLLELFLGTVPDGVLIHQVGAELSRRKGNFEITFGVDYGFVKAADGFYLDKGDDPSQFGEYPDYVEFKGFSLIGLDATFLWHTKLASVVDLRYGAGVGALILLGDIEQTDTVCGANATPDDLSSCALQPGTTVNASKPPVLPIVNLVVGLRFRAGDMFHINVEGGLRDVPFVGASAHYFF